MLNVIKKKRGRTLLEAMVKIMALYIMIVSQVCTYDQETYIKNVQPFLYASHASIKKYWTCQNIRVLIKK